MTNVVESHSTDNTIVKTIIVHCVNPIIGKIKTPPHLMPCPHQHIWVDWSNMSIKYSLFKEEQWHPINTESETSQLPGH